MKKLTLGLLLACAPTFFAHSAYVTFEISELHGSRFIDRNFEEVAVTETRFNVTYEFSTQNLRNEVSPGQINGNTGEVIGESTSYRTYFPSEQRLQITPFEFIFDDFLSEFSRASDFDRETNYTNRELYYSNTGYEIFPQFLDLPEAEHFKDSGYSGFYFAYQDLRFDWTLENNQYVGQRVSSSINVQDFAGTSPAISGFGNTDDLDDYLQSLVARDAILSFSRQTNVHDFVSDDTRVDFQDFTATRSFNLAGNARVVAFDLENSATSVQVSEPSILGLLLMGAFGAFYTRRK